MEKGKIPPTDARFRPDQRALEEGRFAEAENVKLGLEQAQRDRRRQRDHGQVLTLYQVFKYRNNYLFIFSWIHTFLFGSNMKEMRGKIWRIKKLGELQINGSSTTSIGKVETVAFRMSTLSLSGED